MRKIINGLFLALSACLVLACSDDDSKALVIDNLSGCNYPLWLKILDDSRARVTFDMGNRGLVLFDRKRIKQNYLL